MFNKLLQKKQRMYLLNVLLVNINVLIPDLSASLVSQEKITKVVDK